MELLSCDQGALDKASSKHTPKGDYEVGYCRTPAYSRFKPGQSGNPNGRPKGRLNLKTEVERVVSRKVTVHDGQTDRQMSLLAANVLAQGTKGAHGDSRASQAFFNGLSRMNLLDWGEDAATDAGNATIASAVKPRASEWVTIDLDGDRLSREEVIELSRLAEVIDLGGNFTALSEAEFKRLKHIVGKGRGRDVTPH